VQGEIGLMLVPLSEIEDEPGAFSFTADGSKDLAGVDKKPQKTVLFLRGRNARLPPDHQPGAAAEEAAGAAAAGAVAAGAAAGAGEDPDAKAARAEAAMVAAAMAVGGGMAGRASPGEAFARVAHAVVDGLATAGGKEAPSVSVAVKHQRATILAIRRLPDKSQIPEELKSKLRLGDVVLRVNGSVVRTCAAAMQAIFDCTTTHVKLHIGRPTEMPRRNCLTWGERTAIVALQRQTRLVQMRRMTMMHVHMKQQWATGRGGRPLPGLPNVGALKASHQNAQVHDGAANAQPQPQPQQPQQQPQPPQEQEQEQQLQQRQQQHQPQQPQQQQPGVAPIHTQSSTQQLHGHPPLASPPKMKKKKKKTKGSLSESGMGLSMTPGHKTRAVTRMMDGVLADLLAQRYAAAQAEDMERAHLLARTITALKGFRQAVAGKEQEKLDCLAHERFLEAQQANEAIVRLNGEFLSEYDQAQAQLTYMHVVAIGAEVQAALLGEE
jgi:hypothetical protein